MTVAAGVSGAAGEIKERLTEAAGVTEYRLTKVTGTTEDKVTGAAGDGVTGAVGNGVTGISWDRVTGAAGVTGDTKARVTGVTGVRLSGVARNEITTALKLKKSDNSPRMSDDHKTSNIKSLSPFNQSPALPSRSKAINETIKKKEKKREAKIEKINCGLINCAKIDCFIQLENSVKLVSCYWIQLQLFVSVRHETIFGREKKKEIKKES